VGVQSVSVEARAWVERLSLQRPLGGIHGVQVSLGGRPVQRWFRCMAKTLGVAKFVRIIGSFACPNLGALDLPTPVEQPERLQMNEVLLFSRIYQPLFSW